MEVHHSGSYARRERRLTVTTDALQRGHALGDRQVSVVRHGAEWAGAEDSDHEEQGPRMEHHHSDSYNKRERRLSATSEALAQRSVLGDVEVRVRDHGEEWRGAADSDDDADGA